MWVKIKQHNPPDSGRSLGLCVEPLSMYTLPSPLWRWSSLCIRSCLLYKCWPSLTPSPAGISMLSLARHHGVTSWKYPVRILLVFTPLHHMDYCTQQSKDLSSCCSGRSIWIACFLRGCVHPWRRVVSYFPHCYMTCLWAHQSQVWSVWKRESFQMGRDPPWPAAGEDGGLPAAESLLWLKNHLPPCGKPPLKETPGSLPPHTCKRSCKATRCRPTSCDPDQQQQCLSGGGNPGHCAGDTNKSCPQGRLRLEAGLPPPGPSQNQHLQPQSPNLPGGTFLNALQSNKQRSNNSRPKLCE